MTKYNSEHAFQSGLPVVRWEGDFSTNHSLGIVNSALSSRLMASGLFNFIAVNPDDGVVQGTVLPSNVPPRDLWAEITVRHRWPPDLRRPHSGKWVLMQPWEYGALPRIWYVPMKYWVDEVWVNSEYTRECYIRSGIPANKIKVLPLGFDPELFAPEGRSFPLNTRKRFKFLFVGGTIPRKGIDLLLEAYTEEFSSSDDVCLIIKDFGTNSFYKGQTAQETIRSIQLNPQNPEILYIDDEMDAAELAGLYRASDCLVHPYRGEGFGLPILEAMASGLAVIVPDKGPVVDFCTQQTAFFVRSEEERLPSRKVGDLDTVDNPWWLRVDKGELRKWLRFAYEHPDAVRERGMNARSHVLSRFTWDHSAEKAKQLLLDLFEKETSTKPTDEQIAEREMSRGIELYRQKRLDEAISVYQALLDVYPEATNIRYDLTVMLFDKGNFTEAFKHFVRISEHMENRPPEYQAKIWNLMGICKAKTDDFAQAAFFFLFAYHMDPVNPEILQNIRHVASKLLRDLGGDPNKADTIGQIYANICDRLIERKEYASARRILVALNDLFPNDIENMYRLALVHYFEGNLDHAVRSLEKALASFDINKHNPAMVSEIYNLLGAVYFQAEDYFTAERVFLQALELDPHYDILRNNLQEVRQRIENRKAQYRADRKINVIWRSPLFDGTGYALEQANFLQYLRGYPLNIRAIPNDHNSFMDAFEPELREYLIGLTMNDVGAPHVFYQAGPAYQFTLPTAPVSIGRSMFETDSIPKDWVARLNRMTEVWVPTEFNKETFSNSGVSPERIFVVPEAIDGRKYDPERIAPYPLKGVRGFIFVSVFDWDLRKGWDLLLRAYAEEFDDRDDVTLVIKITKHHIRNVDPISIYRKITWKAGKMNPPHLKVIDDYLTAEQMLGLYSAADAFVLPSRGEGWGRPYMEAMAMGLPTIGTNWSGQLAFMNEQNSYLIKVEKLVPTNSPIPLFHGQKWAEPSLDHLRKLMRTVYENRQQAKEKGKFARADLLERFAPERVGNLIYTRIRYLVERYFGI